MNVEAGREVCLLYSVPQCGWTGNIISVVSCSYNTNDVNIWGNNVSALRLKLNKLSSHPVWCD
jgi:glutaredoxin-related protein